MDNENKEHQNNEDLQELHRLKRKMRQNYLKK